MSWSAKRLMQYLAPILLALGFGQAGNAQSLTSGEYVRLKKSAWLTSGWLKIEQQSGQTVFSLDSIGANCHTCSVSGRVVGTIGYANDEISGEESTVCRIRMAPSDGVKQLEVQPLAEEACRNYCGMRASFDGIYQKPTKLCTKAGQRSARDRFMQHYRSKLYPKAIAALLPLLDECHDFMDWIEIDRVRNDLALAYLHSGSVEQCQRTLQSTVAAGHLDEESLRERLPPCDFDNYLSTAQATWHNMRLCSNRQTRPQ